ncbi:MAG: alpha/beta hydrolase-fold protein, partial [Bacteroidota bacterium]
GALHLGTRYAEKFKAISAHSAITRFDEMAVFVEEPLDDYQLRNSKSDVIDIIKENKKILPDLRFDCGRNDDLIEGNRLLHQQLLDLEIPHSYEEFEGGHEWPYWQKHVEKTFRFFNANLH